MTDDYIVVCEEPGGGGETYFLGLLEPGAKMQNSVWGCCKKETHQVLTSS